MKPVTSSRGISSQDNGAQQLPGSYNKHPAPPNIGKTNSYQCDPRMGSKGGGDKLGSLAGRKGK